MKKRLVAFISLVALLAITVIPVFAFSSIQFLVTDNKTSQPWGTTAGQSYRIFVTGSVSGTLLDTTTLTTPADPVLDFTCSYGGACPPVAATTLTAPAAGETVTVFIILTGTNGNPSTITESYTQPPVDLGTFTINRQSGTGPTAVTLADFTPAPTTTAFPLIAAAFIMLGSASYLLLRRRTTQATVRAYQEK